MERFFNIAGPCNPTDHYMLPAMARLPDVISLIRKKQYFVVHALLQCGKTTAFLALIGMRDIRERGTRLEIIGRYLSWGTQCTFSAAET